MYVLVKLTGGCRSVKFTWVAVISAIVSDTVGLVRPACVKEKKDRIQDMLNQHQGKTARY